MVHVTATFLVVLVTVTFLVVTVTFLVVLVTVTFLVVLATFLVVLEKRCFVKHASAEREHPKSPKLATHQTRYPRKHEIPPDTLSSRTRYPLKQAIPSNSLSHRTTQSLGVLVLRSPAALLLGELSERNLYSNIPSTRHT